MPLAQSHAKALYGAAFNLRGHTLGVNHRAAVRHPDKLGNIDVTGFDIDLHPYKGGAEAGHQALFLQDILGHPNQTLTRHPFGSLGG